MGFLERVFYRALLRELGCGYQSGRRSLKLTGLNAVIPVVDPVSTDLFGNGRHLNSCPTLLERLYAWSGPGTVQLHHVSDWVSSLGRRRALDFGVSRKDLVRLVRTEFQSQRVEPVEISERVSKALKVINKFIKLAECTSFSHSNGVFIELTSAAHPEFPDKGHFFVYRVRILNDAPDHETTVRLLGRHWSFRNSSDEEDIGVEKFGEGVVGMRPILIHFQHPSGQVFEYVSGSEISTETGSMEGALLFENLETGDRFEVPIKRTRLLS